MNNIKNIIKVSNHFQKLVELYTKLNEFRRAASFNAALSSITSYVADNNLEDLPEDISLLPRLSRVGDSSLEEIKSCLSKGTSDRLIELERRIETEEIPSSDSAKNLLNSILGK